MSVNAWHDVLRLRAEGASLAEIAERTGVPKSTLHKRLGGLRNGALKARCRRACLCCGTAFLSEGAHNRLCHGCRKQSSNPYDLPATVRTRTSLRPNGV